MVNIVYDLFLFILVIAIFAWGLRGLNKTSNEAPSYRELLADPRWKKKRRKIIERDGGRCVWCGRTDHLEVHHKCYYRYPDGSYAYPWDYPDENLMTLCRDCHEKYHMKYRVGVYYRKRGVHYE